MANHYSLGIYDYQRKKICDLYDSQNDLSGQAYGIQVSLADTGYHTLEFKIPYMAKLGEDISQEAIARYGYAIFGTSRFSSALRNGEGSADRNFRWYFMKSDYLIRYTEDEKTIWYVANKPTKSRAGKKITGTVVCSGTESLLKTRSIYKSYDDENGIGTISYLITDILAGTGWHFDDRTSDIPLENDGVTEKVRSLKSDGKQGALALIATVCNLFECRPVFDTDKMLVSVKSMKNRTQVLEGEVGRNLSAITVNHDSSDIATRVYVEGEYGDNGYVGIDDVEVDGEPWGLSFLLNFDYYREIGVFTSAHEQALADYLRDIRAKKAEIRANALLMISVQDQLNNLIGQCKMALYYKSEGYITPVYVYGGITTEQAMLHVNDDVVILKNNGTHTYEKWLADPATQMADAWGVAKFAIPSSGRIGAAEVQIEAKEKNITKLQAKIDVTIKPDKIAEYRREIAQLEDEIETIYEGNDAEDVEGLYDMMTDVMKPDGLLYELANYEAIDDRLNEEQDDIEATFIAAMGYLLRDGYWSNQNYVIGQEEFLFADATDMVKIMSRPKTSYTFSFVRIAEEFGLSIEDIEINSIFKLHDEELEIDDRMYVKKITYGVDDKSLGNIEVSNNDITMTGGDLGSLLSRMSQLADLIEQKNALYERAKALTSNGTLYTDRLNGAIDATRTQIMASVSNWYTDSRGNIVFLAADGNSAMMISGAGMMLANAKTEDGEWDWRSMMTGDGLIADEIVAGFISAERIEAGSITTNKLAAEVGSQLDLSSNTTIKMTVGGQRVPLDTVVDDIVQPEIDGLDDRVNTTNTSIVEAEGRMNDALSSAVTGINSTIDQKIAEMALTDEEFTIMFGRTVETGINNSIDGVQDNLTQYQTDVANYMRYDANGVLTLGKQGSNFMAQLTNTRMSFLEANAEVAYISNQSMYITQARITDTLSLGTNNGYGYFDWTVTPTGLGLKWRDPVSLRITQTFTGDLTDETIRQQLAYTVTGKDVGGANINTLTITYGDFQNGAYRIANLPEGETYTITQTNAETLDDGYTLVAAESVITGSATIPHSGIIGIALTNKYTAV